MSKKLIQKNASFDNIEEAISLIKSLIARKDMNNFSFGGNFTKEEKGGVIRFNVNWEEEETF